MTRIETKSHPFWTGKRVFVTGHTGFKGSWLCYWLHQRGAHVTAYAREPATKPNLFELLRLSDLVDSHYGEITDSEALRSVMRSADAEIVFHLAAQAQVSPAYAQPSETFSTNVMGTVALLDAVRQCKSVRACQIATSDKCYAQPGSGRAFEEGDALGGCDPYSASKAAVELVVASFRESYFSTPGACSIASVRAGNALGGGDWSGQRLFPNSVRALVAGQPVPVTHPESVRPWQYVLEPLSGYLLLAQKQYEQPATFAEAWNFGPEDASAVTVLDLVHRIVREWGGGEWELVGRSPKIMDEPVLRISIDKVRRRLAWRPAYALEETVRATVQAYQTLYCALQEKEPHLRVRAMCTDAIGAYTLAAFGQGIAWASEGGTPVIALAS